MTTRTTQAPARMTSARARLQPDDRAPTLGVERAVALDLAIDLGAVEDRAQTISGS